MTAAPPQALRVIADSREQLPWAFDVPHPFALEVVRGKLNAGDYAVEGVDAAIERKTLEDLVGTLTVGRERFEREMALLAAMKRAAIVVEAPLEALIAHRYRSQVSARALLNSLSSFHARFNVATVWAGNRVNGQHVALSLLAKWAKHLAPTGAPPEAP